MIKFTRTQLAVAGTAAAVSVFAAAAVLLVYYFRNRKNSKQTMDKKTTGAAGIALIKKFEGLKLSAYKPVASEKYYTIGYGHYGADVKQDQTVTEAEAETLLKKDLATAEQAVNSLGVALSQNQFDALVSFAYNCGTAAFLGSTLCKKVKANSNDSTIADEFARWNKSGKTVLAGLTKRRAAEAELYFA